MIIDIDKKGKKASNNTAICACQLLFTFFNSNKSKGYKLLHITNPLHFYPHPKMKKSVT